MVKSIQKCKILDHAIHDNLEGMNIGLLEGSTLAIVHPKVPAVAFSFFSSFLCSFEEKNEQNGEEKNETENESTPAIVHPKVLGCSVDASRLTQSVHNGPSPSLGSVCLLT